MVNAKEILIKKLKAKNCFWSFDIHSGLLILDDILIEKNLLYLDIEDINILFKLYPYSKIKKVWHNRLILQGEYFGKLNILLAWMYFDIKNPERYIKRTINQQIHTLSCKA